MDTYVTTIPTEYGRFKCTFVFADDVTLCYLEHWDDIKLRGSGYTKKNPHDGCNPITAMRQSFKRAVSNMYWSTGLVWKYESGEFDHNMRHAYWKVLGGARDDCKPQGKCVRLIDNGEEQIDFYFVL